MTVEIINADVIDGLHQIADGDVNTVVTSPPYFALRDYGVEGQIGIEATPEEFIDRLVGVFREVRRVLRDDGTLWLNLGDSYNAYNANRGKSSGPNKNHLGRMPVADRGLTVPDLKQKDLIGIPWRVALALQADGWYLRQDIIWHKPNPMPESVSDRCTKAHEYVFLLTKSPRYYYDSDAIREPYAEKTYTTFGCKGSGYGDETGLIKSKNWHETIEERKPHESGKANKRSVWTVSNVSYPGAHFATFPPDLIRPCILAGAPVGGLVLDPFGGSGTTGEVAEMEGRHSILIEINPEYCELIRRRTAQRGLFTNGAAAADRADTQAQQ